MKGPDFDALQEFIRQEAKYLNTDDFVARRRRLQVGYNGALAAPDYFAVFDYAPYNIPALNLPKPSNERPVVDITVAVTVTNDNSASVNTIGFVASALGYSPSLPQDPNSAAFDRGSQMPSIDTECGFNPYEGLTAYDPIALPIGGVQFPIFTQCHAEPLTARNVPIYLARSGLFSNAPPPPITGRYLWAGAIVQINGNATVADAGTVTFQWSWSPTE